MIQEFFKPETAKEAVRLKKENPEALFLAGGTWVNCFDSKLEPEKVIGLEKLELNGIEKTDGKTVIGAGVTLQELIDSDDIPCAVKESAKFQGSRNIRNMATIGGDIAANLASSSMIPVLTVLNAELVVLEDAEKTVPVYDYVKNDNKALILKVIIKDENRTCAVKKFSRTARGEPLAITAASYIEKDGKITSPVIAAGCIDKHVIRLEKTENLLEGKALLGREEIEKSASEEINPEADYRAGKEFRKHITGVCVASCFYEKGRDSK